MSDTATAAANAPATQTPPTDAAALAGRIDVLEKAVGETTDLLKKAAETRVYPPGFYPGAVYGHAPHVTSGAVGRDSAGYSMLKAIAFSAGAIGADQAKEEVRVSEQLKALYKKHGAGDNTWAYGGRTFLVPTGTKFLPGGDDPDDRKFAGELRQKCLASTAGYDPDEAAWINRRVGGVYGESLKALGTVSDTAGGTLVPYPTLGETIDLQRNMEVFPNAGATEIALPASGRISFPKLTGGATAYWVGEAATITPSQQTTGQLKLVAKKLATLVPMNNEFLRFASPAGEGMVRTDMARVSALKADLAMLQGTGGDEIQGVITYSDITTHTATTVGTDGNTFQPEDAKLMEAKLPDAVQQATAWVMRRLMYAYIANRRADAVTAADGKGPFLMDAFRTGMEGPYGTLNGVKVVRSNQVANDRVKNSGTTLTYILLGYFPDWIIGRAGVVELLANPYSDTAFTTDQTHIRAIQHLDAGARHGASFVFCDTLVVG